MANEASWTKVYKRINQKRKEANLTWNQLAALAGIPVGTWMTGLPISHPTEAEVHKIADVPQMNTTYEYLRYGTN
jgi:hypothetical protein